MLSKIKLHKIVYLLLYNLRTWWWPSHVETCRTFIKLIFFKIRWLCWIVLLLYL